MIIFQTSSLAGMNMKMGGGPASLNGLNYGFF